MLVAGDVLRATGIEAVRFATPDSLEDYSAKELSVVSCQLSVTARSEGNVAARIQQLQSSRTLVDRQAALEESFFLGLRLNRGVSFSQLRSRFGDSAIDNYAHVIGELRDIGLLELQSDRLRLTARGRLLSNEVFVRFLAEETIHHRDTEARKSS